MSDFQECFASIGGMLILSGGVGTGLSFYGDWAFSWYFLISYDPKS